MQVQYSDEEFYKLLFKGAFKTPQFNNNKNNHHRLIEFLSRLPLPDLETVPSPIFSLVDSLIKFYGTPILICFAQLYAKLYKFEDLVEAHSETIRNLAALVKGTVEGKKPNELQFFFICGSSKKKFQLSKSREEEQFLVYINKLGTMLNELETKIKKGKGSKGGKEFQAELNDIFAMILEADIGRKQNIIEVNYENYFKEKAIRKINDIEQLYTEDLSENNFMANKHSPPQRKNQMEAQKPPSQQNQVGERIPLCCRTYFFKGQRIQQPESLHIEYKHYKFPYKSELVSTLKKTICGFLNAQGGTIFVGIAEPVDTKRRIVQGAFYDQAVKEDVLRQFRKIAETIQPDIITYKLYSVSFVPIKNEKAPNYYISGKYIIKIVVRHGLRDDIYSYKNENTELFAFRTENEILHRQGRQVLNALRERIKNPLPIPIPIHEGPCAKSENGKPIYSGESSFDQSFDDVKKYQLPQGKAYNQPEAKKPEYREVLKNKSYEAKRDPGIRGNRERGNRQRVNYQPKQYHYLIRGINEEQLKKAFRKFDFSLQDLKIENMGADDTYLRIQTEQKLVAFAQLRGKLEQSNVQFTEAFNRVIISPGQSEETHQMVTDALMAKKIKFEVGPGQGLYKFQNYHSGIDAILTLKTLGVPCEFTK